MDKNSNVGTQYIICECGDNFPDENLLNIHLANDHGSVEVYQCNACIKYFPTKLTLQEHTCDHVEQETILPTINVKPKNDKKPQPPVIKLKNLKRIDSISLIQSLKSFSGLIKLEPAEEMEQVQEEPSQVPVKSEVQDPEVATEEIYYQCELCNTIFYTESDFNVHYQSTHAMKVEPTPEEILEDHLVTDHSCDVDMKAEASPEAEAVETAYYYECEMCHKIFASEEYFNIHYSRVHAGLLPLPEEPEEPEEPEQTEDTVAEPESQDDDLIVMQEEEEVEEELEEPTAEEEKETDYSIEEYKAPHKSAEQVIYYKCDLCKILYPSEKAYNTHFDKKHGSQACQSTPIGFKFIEQDLNGETRRPASGEDVFCCEFCPKAFNIKRSLQVHRKRVHSDRLPAGAPSAKQPNRSKVCDICGRAYNSNAALRYHQRRHTGEKPYPCTLCPKRFTMPMFLQIHMRTHTGEKPYECPHCPKAFTNKAALIRHDRVHTGLKPYPCPECGKFFTQSNSMKLHVSTVHLKLPAPYKSKNRRDKSEARALQLALKNLPPGEGIDD